MNEKTTYNPETEFNLAFGWLATAAISIVSWAGIA